MPWFIWAALAMVVLPSIALTVDHIRRRGFPRLSRVRLPSFRRSPAASDGFYRRLAEAIIKGEFRKKPLRRKPFVELFPTQDACPHCKGKRRKSWGVAEAGRLVNDVAALDRQIKRRRLCLSCLEQLSEIAKLVVEKQPKELGKKDPKSVPRFSLPLGRVAVVLFLAGLFAYNFAHEVMIGPAHLEGIFLWAAFGVASLMSLQKLTRKDLFPLLVIVAAIALIIRGLAR